MGARTVWIFRLDSLGISRNILIEDWLSVVVDINIILLISILVGFDVFEDIVWVHENEWNGLI